MIMRNIFDFIILSISIVWCIFSISIMLMYAAGKMGPTPVYMPIFFALISYSGALTSILLAHGKKIKKSSATISFLLFGAALIFQIKSLAEIMYVA